MAKSRPIATHYSAGSISHSTCPNNAVVNAIRRILNRQYRAADIYNESGTCIASIAYSDRFHLVVNLRHPRSFNVRTIDTSVVQAVNQRSDATAGAVVHH